jgi:outer membrane lipoprotein-sorting protein
MKLEARLLGLLMTGVLAAGVSAAGDAGATNSALKQVSKATKDVLGIVAEVEYSEIVGKRSIDGSGKLYVNFAGLVRAEIGGDNPRTVLFSPPYLYVHRKEDEVVDFYDVTSNPHRLGQYILLGFVPAGNAMKKRFNVELVETGTLDGSPVLNFLMTPKLKEVARAIARIQLWVDPENGLPLQQKIFHAASDTRLEIRYRSMTRDDELPASLFQPDWPDGTTTIRK